MQRKINSNSYDPGASARSRYVAFLTGWLIPELANNVYAELSL